MIVQLLSHMYSHWERKTPSGEVEGGVNLFKQQKIWDKKNRLKKKILRDGSEEERCYMAQLSGGGWGCWFVCNKWNAGQLERWWTDWRTEGGGLLLLLLTERWEGCQWVKTARRELRHESMKCKNKEGRNGGHRAVMGGAAEGRRGAWGFWFPRPLTQRPLLVFPVFLDVEVPLPGQVVMLVIVSKLGFDGVVATGHDAFRSLLQRGQEVVFSATRPIAAHHVVRLINCQWRRAGSMVREPFLRTFTFKYCFYFHTVETKNERSLVTNRNSP